MAALAMLFVGGCALLAPLPPATTLEDRLAVFPKRDLKLKGKVTVRWDNHQIPFIEAEHDTDAAFVLGLVHAHLRLGQMEILRRISKGRIAEMGGPLAVDIDHGLRTLDFRRGALKSEAELPKQTGSWLDAFVAGINHYQTTVKELPYEFAVLGLKREPWTITDVLTFGRLAGTDVNWLVWFNLLKLRGRDDWPRIWARLVENGSDSTPSFGPKGRSNLLNNVLADFSRSGSNSLVIAPSRSATRSAIMANDPHLGLYVPNLWIVAGLKSPSYHAIGLMVPGLPIFAIGRNPWIAWGGTNMRAAASDLIDLSRVPTGSIVERRERIRVRWWFDTEVTLRETRWGPVITDAPLLKKLNLPNFALRWTGHDASDELGAMLAVSRARSFDDFRNAFRSFGVSGQNMLYADRKGNIGQVMAVRLPDRNSALPKDLIVDPVAAEAAWARRRGVLDLPFSLNPEQGFLASANNRPTKTDIHVGTFYSPDDRVNRMADIISTKPRMGISDVKSLQRDVYMASAAKLNRLFLRKLRETDLLGAATGKARRVLDLLAAWDGSYKSDAQAPVAFELFRNAFSASFYEFTFGTQDWFAFANMARIKSLLIEDIEAAAPARIRAALRHGLTAAADGIDDFANWGEMHRLGLAHPLSFLPLVGSRFRFADHPIGGSTDTLMKTAHGAVEGRHFARYGSNARHISDLSDPDENYFVLLGGQDGWINAANFLDQVPLWLKGDYVRMPLRLKTVKERFPHVIELGPK
jgi:penicillin amidase